MSFIHKLSQVYKLCFENPHQKFSKTSASIVALGVFMHATYSYGSRRNDIEKITIENKYQIFNKGTTHFVVSTTKGKQMIIPYSLWYWQFDVPEKWDSLEVGKTYKVKTYGYRIPFLGMFENIVQIRFD